MADTLVNGSPNANLDRRGLQGPYWTDKDTGVIVFVDSATNIAFTRTTDAGATWSKTTIYSSGDTSHFRCWFDKETPGDTGTLLHVVWLDSTDNKCYYVNIDISDGTVGTIRTIASGLTVSSLGYNVRVSITKTLSGNLIIAYSTQNEIECLKSSDSFATAGTTISDVFETGTEEDWVMLFPANTGDNNDACAVFRDRSLSNLYIKMYDDSADSWTSTLVAGLNVDLTFQNMDGAIRHSDKHLLLAAHSFYDSVGDDLRTWDITVDSISSPTITSKTNIYTNQGESVECGVVINQQNDDVYVAYLKGGVWGSLTDVVFHKSTDGMTTWGTEQSYSETQDDIRLVHGGRTISDNGGRIQWSFYNDDLIDIYVNLVNDIEITANSSGSSPSTQSLSLSQLTPTISLISSPTVTPSNITLTGSVLSPTIGTGGNAIISPSELSLISTLNSPTIGGVTDSTFSASELSLTSTLNSITAGSGHTAQSTSIDYNNGTITTATLTSTEVSGSFIYEMTADGTNWEQVSSGVPHTFTNTGTDLRWRATGTGEISKIEVTNYH